jgi:hypothetical protein
VYWAVSTSTEHLLRLFWSLLPALSLALFKFAYYGYAQATIDVTVPKWEYSPPPGRLHMRIQCYCHPLWERVFVDPGICFSITTFILYLCSPFLHLPPGHRRCSLMHHNTITFNVSTRSLSSVLTLPPSLWCHWPLFQLLKKFFCEPTRHAILFLLFFVCPNFSITRTSMLDKTAHNSRMRPSSSFVVHPHSEHSNQGQNRNVLPQKSMVRHVCMMFFWAPIP